MGQADIGVEEAVHLVANAGDVASGASLAAGDAELAHEVGEGAPEHELAALRAKGLGAYPCQHEAREGPVGQPSASRGGHDELVRAVRAPVLKALAGVGAGQGAQHQQAHQVADVGCFELGCGEQILELALPPGGECSVAVSGGGTLYGHDRQG